MKIRSDYVSNSSSASFVVNGFEPAKAFYDDFGEFLNQYEVMGESMRVKVRISDAKDDWDYVDLLDFVREIDDGKRKWEDIEVIDFYCDDYDSTGCTYLRLLYAYFEKLGFNPNDDDSEMGFRDESGSDNMMFKLMKRIGELSHESEK